MSGSVFAEAGEGWPQDLVGTAKSKPGEKGIASVQGLLKDSHSRVTFTLVIDFDSSSPRKKNTPHAVFTLVVSDSTASSPIRLPAHLEQAAPVHTSQTSPQISSPTHPRPPMVEITAAEYLKLQREVNMATRKAEAAHSATATLLSTLPLPSRIAALDADLRSSSAQNPPMSPEKRFQQGKQKLKLMQELQARSTEAVKGELVGVVKGVLGGTGRSVG